MNYHTTVTYEVDANRKDGVMYRAVVDIEFQVDEDDYVEIVDTQLVDLAGATPAYRARHTAEILQQFNPADFQAHFVQVATDWPGIAATPLREAASEPDDDELFREFFHIEEPNV